MFSNLLSTLLSRQVSLHPARARRLQFYSIVTIFAGLGFYVGVWAILIADLANALQLTPALLGVALACIPCTGIVVLLLGGAIADRVTRRVMLLVGIGGNSLFLVVLALVPNYALLLLTLLFGGASSSLFDLSINTLGGDYEREHASKAMMLFSAGFSAGAALGALGSAVLLTIGVHFRLIYAATALLFLLLFCAAFFFPLPSVVISSQVTEEGVTKKSGASILSLLAVPVVLLGTLIVGLSFFTDGALEGFISLYLRDLLGSGALLGGVGIAAFYLIGMVGRIGSAAFLRRYGERVVVTLAALISAAGLALALSTTSSLLVVLGLALVGIGQAPLVPTGFSLAAQVEGRSTARAIAVVTAVGYTVFLAGPPLIGFLASLFSLRVALLLTIATSLGIVITAQHLPGTGISKRSGPLK